jgi:hypothetical protein
MPMTRRQGITNRRKQNPKTQESAAQHPGFPAKSNTLSRQLLLSLRPIRILHGRQRGTVKTPAGGQSSTLPTQEMMRAFGGDFQMRRRHVAFFLYFGPIDLYEFTN